jgi:benzil reductase ((S)-benzoin forming)
MAELFVLTGASRGLGRALASQLLAPDTCLLTLSRKPDASLAVEAAARGAHLIWSSGRSMSRTPAAWRRGWRSGCKGRTRPASPAPR